MPIFAIVLSQKYRNRWCDHFFTVFCIFLACHPEKWIWHCYFSLWKYILCLFHV